MNRRMIGIVTMFSLLVGLVGFAAIANGKSLRWTPANTWVDNVGNTGTFTPAEMATMKYRARIDKPNPADTVGKLYGTTRWYLVGTIPNGGTSWPSDNNIEGVFQGYGFEGQVLQFTVTEAYTEPANGIEYESVLSPAYTWTVPIPFRPRTPGAPAGPGIN